MVARRQPGDDAIPRRTSCKCPKLLYKPRKASSYHNLGNTDARLLSLQGEPASDPPRAQPRHWSRSRRLPNRPRLASEKRIPLSLTLLLAPWTRPPTLSGGPRALRACLRGFYSKPIVSLMSGTRQRGRKTAVAYHLKPKGATSRVCLYELDIDFVAQPVAFVRAIANERVR